MTMLSLKRHRTLPVVFFAAGLVLGACAADPADDAATDGDEGAEEVEESDDSDDATGHPGEPESNITFLSGFDPGGGIDLAINTSMSVLESEGIVNTPMNIAHQPGGASLVAAGRLISEDAGRDDIVFLTSASALRASIEGTGGVHINELQPLARIFTEASFLFVDADSPIQTLQDFTEAIETERGDLIVGGPSLGSTAHIAFAMLVQELGLSLDDVTYQPMEGGEGHPALLGGHIDVLFQGPEVFQLVEGGEARVIVTTAEEGIDPPSEEIERIPSIVEEGYDISIGNWRAIFGPPGMPDETIEFWVEAFAEMVETDSFGEVAAANTWEIAYLNDEELAEFIEEDGARLEDILQEAGLLE